MIVYKCMNQLKMILSGVDALCIFFTFTLCQIQSSFCQSESK
jgi:hypothetical protein